MIRKEVTDMIGFHRLAASFQDKGHEDKMEQEDGRLANLN